MLIPEVVLYNTLNAIIQLVRDSYNNDTSSGKTDNILYDLFFNDNNQNRIIFEKLDFNVQAISLFTRTDETPRAFKVNIGYNTSRANLPTIHIILPQDARGRYDSLGWSEGEFGSDYDIPTQTEKVTKVATHQAVFNLMITSDSVTEVLLIYYLFRAMLIYIDDTFEIFGLHNINFTGQDVQLDPAYAPPNIFHRNLTIQFDYQDEIKFRWTRDMSDQLQLLICSQVGDDFNNAYPPTINPSFRATIHQTIVINKLDDSLTVQGTVKLINLSTGGTVVTNQTINLVGSNNNFTLDSPVASGHYQVTIDLDFTGVLTGSIGDGAGNEYDISPEQVGSFFKTLVFNKVNSDTLFINLEIN